MKVAYNNRNGRVFRVLGDNEQYHPGVAHSIVKIPLGNDDLLDAIADRPGQFIYDGDCFVENGAVVWEINTRSEDGKVNVNDADITATIQALQDAPGWAQARQPLADLALVVGRLAEAMGMTPVTPAVVVA